MSDLASLFAQAQADVKTLAEKPDPQTLLQLYALFKQASSGDVSGERPGMMDFINRAKYDAWERYRGYSSDAAMERYLEVANAQLGR